MLLFINISITLHVYKYVMAPCCQFKHHQSLHSRYISGSQTVVRVPLVVLWLHLVVRGKSPD